MLSVTWDNISSEITFVVVVVSFELRLTDPRMTSGAGPCTPPLPSSTWGYMWDPPHPASTILPFKSPKWQLTSL